MAIGKDITKQCQLIILKVLAFNKAYQILYLFALLYPLQVRLVLPQLLKVFFLHVPIRNRQLVHHRESFLQPHVHLSFDISLDRTDIPKVLEILSQYPLNVVKNVGLLSLGSKNAPCDFDSFHEERRFQVLEVAHLCPTLLVSLNIKSNREGEAVQPEDSFQYCQRKRQLFKVQLLK